MLSLVIEAGRMGIVRRRWNAAVGFAVLAAIVPGCGIFPERVSLDDRRVAPLLRALAEVEATRDSLGFTPVERGARIMLEIAHGRAYDAMLHVDQGTSRTIAFKRTANGYRWISEQEVYTGRRTYDTPD